MLSRDRTDLPVLWRDPLTGAELTPAQRLTRQLQPERGCEEELLAVLSTVRNIDLLADMVERATKREWLGGAECGRAEIEEELLDAT